MTQLRGGIPTIQARICTSSGAKRSRRRNVWPRRGILTTSALRGPTAEALAAEARLFPLRDAYMFNELGHHQAAWGNLSTPNPPYGAVFTYHVGQAPPADARFVLTIADESGKPVRRLDLAKETGVHRIAWPLRGDPPAAGRGPGGGGRGAGGGGENKSSRPSAVEAASRRRHLVAPDTVRRRQAGR
jgi:hypothetical protein